MGTYHKPLTIYPPPYENIKCDPLATHRKLNTEPVSFPAFCTRFKPNLVQTPSTFPEFARRQDGAKHSGYN
ncbi:hypothetical protein CG392_03750 [Gardnerella vaginalis]|nr:hypothetical protein CG392_03750 [Gardnerella vaginalis]